MGWKQAIRDEEHYGVGISDLKNRLWWARRDLNPQPTDYESAALTVELQAPLLHSQRENEGQAIIIPMWLL